MSNEQFLEEFRIRVEELKRAQCPNAGVMQEAYDIYNAFIGCTNPSREEYDKLYEQALEVIRNNDCYIDDVCLHYMRYRSTNMYLGEESWIEIGQYEGSEITIEDEDGDIIYCNGIDLSDFCIEDQIEILNNIVAL